MERASEIVRARDGRRLRLDPPLAVDVGVGADWLNAK